MKSRILLERDRREHPWLARRSEEAADEAERGHDLLVLVQCHLVRRRLELIEDVLINVGVNLGQLLGSIFAYRIWR